jgi:hypothetical protein
MVVAAGTLYAMTTARPPTEEGKMTVFRPRRRCPQCGLVNSDHAKKCRRCSRSFDDIDPALASELMVARLQARRYAVIAIIALLVVGVITAIFMYQAKLGRLAEFTERSRVVEADVVALKRGAVEDASALSKAFDDKEVKARLQDQKASWSNRIDQCNALSNELAELVPENNEQTTRQLALQTDVDRVKQTAEALVAAAASGDVFAARLAADNIAKSAGTSK